MNVNREAAVGTAGNVPALRRRRWWNASSLLTWVYCAIVCGVWLCLVVMSDVTWWGTVLVFAPRWPWLIPLGVLMPAALVQKRWRLLAVQGAAGVAVVWPIMGYTLAIGGGACPTTSGLNLRVMTCNVQGRNVDPQALSAWIDQTGPDIVALQECPSSLQDALFNDGSWSIESDGQLCIASRFPITRTDDIDRRRFGGWGTLALFCRIETSDGPIDFANVHLMTVRPGIEALIDKQLKGIPDLESNIALRRRESDAVRQRLAACREPVIVAGDFNLPVESAIYRDNWSRYTNLFSSAGSGCGQTRFSRWHGIRIDHLLMDATWLPVCCRVGPDVDSDHRPVFGEIRRRRIVVDEQ